MMDIDDDRERNLQAAGHAPNPRDRHVVITRAEVENLATAIITAMSGLIMIKFETGEGITTEEMKELCWLKPKLVAQISFTEWTNYGLLRHGTFEGLRDDKQPRAVVRELVAG